MYKINERLATDGIGEDVYPMPPNRLLTFKHIDDEWTILDVRCLSAEGLNSLDDYEERIDFGCTMLHTNIKKLVVCCGAGQSRSNAIALGILVKFFKMDFWDAWELIKEKVPISQIDPSHIVKLKRLFGVTLP